MRHEMTLPWQKLLDPRTHVRVHQPLRGIVSYLIKCNQIRVHTGKAKSGEEITLWERLTDEEWISIILHFSFHNNGIREMVQRVPLNSALVNGSVLLIDQNLISTERIGLSSSKIHLVNRSSPLN